MKLTERIRAAGSLTEKLLTAGFGDSDSLTATVKGLEQCAELRELLPKEEVIRLIQTHLTIAHQKFQEALMNRDSARLRCLADYFDKSPYGPTELIDPLRAKILLRLVIDDHRPNSDRKYASLTIDEWAKEIGYTQDVRHLRRVLQDLGITIRNKPFRRRSAPVLTKLGQKAA